MNKKNITVPLCFFISLSLVSCSPKHTEFQKEVDSFIENYNEALTTDDPLSKDLSLKGASSDLRKISEYYENAEDKAAYEDIISNNIPKEMFDAIYEYCQNDNYIIEPDLIKYFGYNPESKISSTTEDKETSPTSNVKEAQSDNSSTQDYSIPTEFIDYTKFIGEDISVLNVDTSQWDMNKVSHDLWNGSFYGRSGKISVGLGWDNKTIVEFFMQLDDSEKLSDSEIKELDPILQDIFGNTVEEHNISYRYSGKGDYEFDLPKNLTQESVCLLSWNSDTMLAYMNSKPKPVESPSEKEQVIEAKDEPAIGMTADEVRQSTWGEPSTINRTTTKYSVNEQWVYKSSVKTRYIYFEDGFVTAIQE